MDAINQILIHPLLSSKVCGKLQDPRGVLSDTIRGKAVHLVISYLPKVGGPTFFYVLLFGVALSPRQTHGMEALLFRDFLEESPQVAVWLKSPRPSLGETLTCEYGLGFANVSHGVTTLMHGAIKKGSNNTGSELGASRATTMASESSAKRDTSSPT